MYADEFFELFELDVGLVAWRQITADNSRGLWPEAAVSPSTAAGGFVYVLGGEGPKKIQRKLHFV
jgi:hypothetical protein